MFCDRVKDSANMGGAKKITAVLCDEQESAYTRTSRYVAPLLVVYSLMTTFVLDQDLIRTYATQLCFSVVSVTVLYVVGVLTLTFIDKVRAYYARPRPRFEPERMNPGSRLTPARPPPFQAMISGCVDGKWYVSGQGFRVGHFFCTAAHVLMPYKDIMLTTARGTLELPSSRFENVEGDFSRVILSQEEIQTLGISSGKLVGNVVEVDAGLLVTAVGYDVESHGFLKPHAAFGFVEYGGSTVKGFSGAPYFSGNKIYGMHLGGCTENLGNSSAYLKMLQDSFNEDSEDYLFEQLSREFNRGGDVLQQRDPYDEGYWRFKVKGRYYRLSEAQALKLEERLGDALTKERVGKTPVTYRESIPPPEAPTQEDDINQEIIQELMELLTPATPPKNEIVPAPAAFSNGPLSQPAVVSPPKRVSPPATALLKIPEDSAMAGPTLTPAQLNEVLRNTSSCLKRLRQELPALAMNSSRKRLSTPEGRFAVGRLTYLAQELSSITSTTTSKPRLAAST
uniref:Serine protease n=1 Tax=Soybean thrips sobemo-like virus 7 TaxID=2801037 RepID=A0A7T8IMM7_9VIRU|nr:hypothetical protein [Soybean thrips sobemo-like virus 7]